MRATVSAAYFSLRTIKVLYSMTKNPYGFEGICLAENIDKLAGLNVTKEIPTLYQISVAVMKNNTKIVMR